MQGPGQRQCEEWNFQRRLWNWPDTAGGGISQVPSSKLKRNSKDQTPSSHPHRFETRRRGRGSVASLPDERRHRPGNGGASPSLRKDPPNRLRPTCGVGEDTARYPHVLSQRGIGLGRWRFLGAWDLGFGALTAVPVETNPRSALACRLINFHFLHILSSQSGGFGFYQRFFAAFSEVR